MEGQVIQSVAVTVLPGEEMTKPVAKAQRPSVEIRFRIRNACWNIDFSLIVIRTKQTEFRKILIAAEIVASDCSESSASNGMWAIDSKTCSSARVSRGACLGAAVECLQCIEQATSGLIIFGAHEHRFDAPATSCYNGKRARSDVSDLRPCELFDVSTAASNGDALRCNEVAAVIASEP